MYRLKTFVGDLPNTNLVEQFGTPAAVMSEVGVAGRAVFDADGAAAARPGGMAINRRCWIVHETESAAAAEFDFWRSLVGERRRLYRERIATGDEQWAWARLLQVNAEHDAGQFNRAYIPLEMVFYVPSPAVWNGGLFGGALYWDGTAVWDGSYTFNGGQTAYTVDSNPDWFTLTNAGNVEVTQFELMFTAGDGVDIGQVRIRCNTNQALRWNGTLAAGRALTIDAGKRSVKNNGVDAWSGLTFESTHRGDRWLSLKPGANNIEISYTTIGTASGSAPTVSFRYYHAYR